MRIRTYMLLVCTALISLAVVAAGAEPFVLEELHLIHWEEIPEGSPSYTGPVSAAILMAWYAEHGYPDLLPDLSGDGRIDEDDTLLLARDFGEAMGAHLIDDKLADPFIVYPLARYIAERYPDEFRMLIHDESFPEDVERDLGQHFVPTEVTGIFLDVLEDPFYELYVHHLEEQRPGIVGIGHDIPEWNDFAVSRSYISQDEPDGWPVDLANTGYGQFGPNPVWETLMRLEPERWGFLTPEWIPFEILIILLPEDEESGAPGQPGDNPGDDPGDPFDPGRDPGDPFDPGNDPGDPFDPGGDPGGGDQPRYPGGDVPGGTPRLPGDDEEGVCCMPDGSCDTTTANICAQRGGAFVAGEDCGSYVCPRYGEVLCAKVDGEITDICYTYENGILKVFASYAITNHSPIAANDITAYALVGLNDGVNGLGGGPECQDWQYGLDIPGNSTYTFDRVFTASAPNLDLNNLTYLYGSLWLQVEAPWDCWPITTQAFVQTWDPAPLCNPDTPPGGSGDDSTTWQEADLSIRMERDTPPDDGSPVGAGMDLTYTLHIGNAGPDVAKNTVVELQIPTGITFVQADMSHFWNSTDATATTLQWSLGDMAPSASATITVDVKADSDLCSDVAYQYYAASDTPDPDISNSAAQRPVFVMPCSPSGSTPPGGSDESCAYISARVDDVCYDYRGPNESVLVRATFSIDNFGTAMAQTPWFEAKASYEITVQETTTTYMDYYGGYAPNVPAGGSTSFTHEFDLGLIGQEPTNGILVHLLSRINSPCVDYTEATGTNYSTLRCPMEDDGTGEPNPEPDPEPDPGPDPKPDPEPTLLPNLWVTGMTGCWTWSGGGDEHVIATVTGIVHNGGQASASNVRARVSAGGKTTTVTVGTIAAGGQKTVSATLDVGPYDTTSWPVPTSITADPLHQITEADESNNTTNSSFPQSSDCN